MFIRVIGGCCKLSRRICFLFLKKGYWFIRISREEVGNISVSDFYSFLGKKMGFNGY